jgi:hypothetical protein
MVSDDEEEEEVETDVPRMIRPHDGSYGAVNTPLSRTSTGKNDLLEKKPAGVASSRSASTSKPASASSKTTAIRRDSPDPLDTIDNRPGSVKKSSIRSSHDTGTGNSSGIANGESSTTGRSSGSEITQRSTSVTGSASASTSTSASASGGFKSSRIQQAADKKAALEEQERLAKEKRRAERRAQKQAQEAGGGGAGGQEVRSTSDSRLKDAEVIEVLDESLPPRPMVRAASIVRSNSSHSEVGHRQRTSVSLTPLPQADDLDHVGMKRNASPGAIVLSDDDDDEFLDKPASKKAKMSTKEAHHRPRAREPSLTPLDTEDPPEPAKVAPVQKSKKRKNDETDFALLVHDDAEDDDFVPGGGAAKKGRGKEKKTKKEPVKRVTAKMKAAAKKAEVAEKAAAEAVEAKRKADAQKVVESEMAVEADDEEVEGNQGDKSIESSAVEQAAEMPVSCWYIRVERD